MKTLKSKHTYKIEDLRICNYDSGYAVSILMIMFYERDYVVSHHTVHDPKKSMYFLEITTKEECDDFFTNFKKMFPECKITKITEVTITTVEETEKVLG